jgi:hypothetical protein
MVFCKDFKRNFKESSAIIGTTLNNENRNGSLSDQGNQAILVLVFQ